MSRRIPAIVTVVLAMAATLVAAAPWQDAFVNANGGVPVMVAMAVAAIVGVAVPVLVGGVLRRPVPWSLAALVLTWLVAALAVAVVPAFSLTSLGDGITSGLARMLQSTPPLVVAAGTLVPAFTLVFCVGAVTGELLVRTRVALGLLIAPIIGFGVAYAVTARVAEGSGLGGSTVVWSFVALAVLGLLVVARRLSLDAPTVSTDPAAERAVALRTPILAVVLLAVAAIVALAAVNWIPGLSDDPSGLASEPPRDEPVPDSPVDVMANYRRQEGLVKPPVTTEVLLRLTTDAVTTGYFGVANLDEYDGAAWRFDRLFVPTGFEVPDAPGLDADVVTQQVEVVTALPFADQWLLALDRPIEVPPITISDGNGSRTVQAVYDPATGMVVSPEPLPAGTEYVVRSLTVGSNLASIDPSTPVASALISPPGQTAVPLNDSNNLLAAWSAAVSDATGVPLSGDVDSLLALRDWMRTNLALTDDNIETKVRATGGRPEPVVRTLALLAMTDKVLSGDGQATPEQIATAYVLLARQIGVPARLVTGFRVATEAQRDSGLSPGTYDITGSQAWTWAEVLVGDEGWVVVDATPGAEQTVPPPTTTTIPEGSKQETEIPDEEITAILPNPVAEPPPPVETSPPWGAIIVGVLVLLALLGLFLIAALRRVVRRRSRRQGDPRQQVVGAWLETLDQLHEADLDGLAPLSATEVATAAGQRFGDEVGGPVGAVATLSTPAVFSSAPVDETNATEAWNNLEQARRNLRGKLTVRQRMAATFRSLSSGRRWSD